LHYFYFDEKGNMLGTDWKKTEGSVNEETYQRILKEGILISSTVPLKVKKQIIKVVVYDETNDRVGSKLIHVP